ncbi:hypothetical protein, partial [Burkholderia cenocepacia]|uniref:hypothetical protein n=2 Tax=Burkholderia cepacia complex TaxID=87882 RepID=UPI001C0B41DE
QEGHGNMERAIEADVMASLTPCGIHRTRSLGAARSSFWMPPIHWTMMVKQARRPSAIQHDQVRSGFLSRRSYVAPSQSSRSPATRPQKELTYCPIYGFNPCVLCTKDLTPELFCRRGGMPARQATRSPVGVLPSA